MAHTQTYNFVEDDNIILVKYKGRITLPRVIDCIDSIQKDERCRDDYSFLVDLREAKFENDIKIVKGYFRHTQENYPHVLHKQTVWLADKANQVVMVTLFKLLLGKASRNSAVVSTIPYALSYFSIDLERTKTEELLGVL